VDYVDIFILPFAAKRESVFFEPLLRAMEDIKKQGKAKYIGIATHSYEQEAIQAAADTGIYDIVMTAYNFRKENGEEIKKAIARAAEQGLGIIAMKTMAGAFWDKERKEPIDAKAALKWVLMDENVHTAVPGVTTYEQLDLDLSVMKDLPLREDELKQLKLGRISGPDGIYCQQCGDCVPQCDKNLDIPTAMRGYMYAFGYNNKKHAEETLRLAGISATECRDCLQCAVQCRMRFDIKNKMLGMTGICAS
jgi:predicted aldo/keto reductase-like oxidoreductase